MVRLKDTQFYFMEYARTAKINIKRYNRVGGEFSNSPTSHTTVRTVPYTAVQSA